ncbi:MAG: YlxR family protein [Truepera sp.]|nr:YlxR family protein [Truepera sp.]
MRPRHIPLRRCVACRRSRPQAELIRFVQQEGIWQLDATRRAAGRGAWVCADNPNCHTRKGLGRLFRNQSEAMANALAARYTDSTHNGGTNV